MCPATDRPRRPSTSFLGSGRCESVHRREGQSVEARLRGSSPGTDPGQTLRPCHEGSGSGGERRVGARTSPSSEDTPEEPTLYRGVGVAVTYSRVGEDHGKTPLPLLLVERQRGTVTTRSLNSVLTRRVKRKNKVSGGVDR